MNLLQKIINPLVFFCMDTVHMYAGQLLTGFRSFVSVLNIIDSASDVHCQVQPKSPYINEKSTIGKADYQATHPPTHPDKFEFGIEQHNSQK